MSDGAMNKHKAMLAAVLCVIIVGLFTAITAMRTIPSSIRAGSPPADSQPAAVDSAAAREVLLAKIKKQGNPNEPSNPPIVVSAADFFEGNDDNGSIGHSLSPHPGIKRFSEVLGMVAARQDVQAVLVEIKGIDQADPKAWPFANTIFILTWAPRQSVARWLSELKPNEVSEGYPFGTPPAAPQPMEGAKIYAAWWE